MGAARGVPFVALNAFIRVELSLTHHDRRSRLLVPPDERTHVVDSDAATEAAPVDSDAEDAETEAALALSRGSDREALGRLAAKYGPKVKVWAQAQGCGDTFLDVQRHFAQGKRARNISRLLGKIARNKARSRLRRLRRWSKRGELWAQMGLGDSDVSPEDSAITLETALEHEACSEALRALVEALPEKHRVVLLLRISVAPPPRHGEIAKLLNITAENSRQRYSQALRVLRRGLEHADQQQVRSS
jgi:RNA polymerase sigma factor (sigma-70 family)